MTLPHSSSLRQSQRREQSAEQVALDQEDQLLQISHLSSQEEQGREAHCQLKEAPKISTSSLATRPWPQPVDLVYSDRGLVIYSEGTDCDLGYGIHYPVRHGQVENWVGYCGRLTVLGH